jgi:hypothetical protein
MAATRADEPLHRPLLPHSSMLARDEPKAAESFAIPAAGACRGDPHVLRTRGLYNFRWLFTGLNLHYINDLGFHLIPTFRTDVPLLGRPHVATTFVTESHFRQ